MKTDLPKKLQRRRARALHKLVTATNELTALLIYEHAPTLWLDFLNSDPTDTESMWPVYQSFCSFIEALKSQYRCTTDILLYEFSSKENFLGMYPLSLQQDAERLYTGMRECIDKAMESGEAGDISALRREFDEEDLLKKPQRLLDQQDRARAAITQGAAIPPVSVTILTGYDRIDDEDRLLYYLCAPNIHHGNFWLSVIYEGMTILFHEDGKTLVQRCAAPDCGKYFIPTPRSRNQRYHTQRCRNRHHMQEWRRASKSSA